MSIFFQPVGKPSCRSGAREQTAASPTQTAFESILMKKTGSINALQRLLMISGGLSDTCTTCSPGTFAPPGSMAGLPLIPTTKRVTGIYTTSKGYPCLSEAANVPKCPVAVAEPAKALVWAGSTIAAPCAGSIPPAPPLSCPPSLAPFWSCFTAGLCGQSTSAPPPPLHRGERMAVAAALLLPQPL